MGTFFKWPGILNGGYSFREINEHINNLKLENVELKICIFNQKHTPAADKRLIEKESNELESENLDIKKSVLENQRYLITAINESADQEKKLEYYRQSIADLDKRYKGRLTQDVGTKMSMYELPIKDSPDKLCPLGSLNTYMKETTVSGNIAINVSSTMATCYANPDVDLLFWNDRETISSEDISSIKAENSNHQTETLKLSNNFKFVGSMDSTRFLYESECSKSYTNKTTAPVNITKSVSSTMGGCCGNSDKQAYDWNDSQDKETNSMSAMAIDSQKILAAKGENESMNNEVLELTHNIDLAVKETSEFQECKTAGEDLLKSLKDRYLEKVQMTTTCDILIQTLMKTIKYKELMTKLRENNENAQSGAGDCSKLSE